MNNKKFNSAEINLSRHSEKDIESYLLLEKNFLE